MDIRTLVEVRDTATIDLNDPDGDPLFNELGERMSITVYGPASKQYRKAQGVRNRAIVEFLRKGGGRKMSDEQARELDAEVLASCTVSFNAFTYGDLPANHETFKAFYSDPKMGWANDQVNRELSDWANFTGGSART